jgi:hypothetical protein
MEFLCDSVKLASFLHPSVLGERCKPYKRITLQLTKGLLTQWYHSSSYYVRHAAEEFSILSFKRLKQWKENLKMAKSAMACSRTWCQSFLSINSFQLH